MERSTIFKNGKPSISIRAIYTMAMLKNLMVPLMDWYLHLNGLGQRFSLPVLACSPLPEFPESQHTATRFEKHTMLIGHEV
jgi:hypothetical protein